MGIEQRGPSAMRVIADRIRTKSKRGQREDDHNVHLLVEGGGMAGFVTAHMLAALAEVDPHLDSIDGAHANSAGLLNLAYVGTDVGDGHEITKGLGIYPELTKPPFFDRRRLLNGVRDNGRRPAIDMTYLIYDVMGSGDRELNWRQLAENGLPTTAYITSSTEAVPYGVQLPSLPTQADVLHTLKLTSTIPVYGGRPDPEGTDGGIGSRGVPIREVLRRGDATHVLALLNGPEGRRLPNSDPLTSFAATVLRGEFPALAKALDTLDRGYKANRRLMETPRPDGPIIQTVQVPRGRPQVNVMDMDLGKLLQAARDGREAVASKLRRHLAMAS